MKKHILFYILTFVISQIIFAQNYGWTDISANIPTETDLSDVFFVSDNEGWVTSSSHAEIYHTTDGGETFSTQVTSFGTSTGAIFMIDENEGYAGGASGFVYRTIDSGENWTFYGAISSTLTDMDFASDTIGYACGDGGAVFSITPEGVTNLNSGQSSYFSGISAPSVDNVWTCGGGAILYYDGSTFTFQSGPAGSYNSIFFVDNEEGWVGGDSGITGHTEDGGANWIQQSSPTSNALYDVFFLDDNFGWAVGFNGIILSTTNGGETWIVEGAGLTTNFLRGVHFTSLSNGYAVGNEKTLLKYTQISGTGNELVETLRFEISPNPAKNKFEVSSSEFLTKNCKIELYDLYGKTLIEKQIPAGQKKVEIDVNNLASGVYLCTLRTDKKSNTKKLIIE